MIESYLAPIHVMVAVTALVAGAMIFQGPKADQRHRNLGYLYVAAIGVLVVTSLLIYRLAGTLQVQQLLAVISGLLLAKGLWHVRSRRPVATWFDGHWRYMAWSYIGLTAAAVAETATRVGMPLLAERGVRSFGWFWVAVAVATFFVIRLGIFLMRRHGPELERYRPK